MWSCIDDDADNGADADAAGEEGDHLYSEMNNNGLFSWNLFCGLCATDVRKKKDMLTKTGSGNYWIMSFAA